MNLFKLYLRTVGALLAGIAGFAAVGLSVGFILLMTTTPVLP